MHARRYFVKALDAGDQRAALAQLHPGRSALRLADDRERGAVAVVELPLKAGTPGWPRVPYRSLPQPRQCRACRS